MPPKRSPTLRLQDIRVAIDKILKFTAAMDFETFRDDPKTVDAVIRNLEVIGEAAKGVPASIRKKHAQIPWIEMQGMRNILIHEYFGISERILWETISTSLPKLRKQLKHIKK